MSTCYTTYGCFVRVGYDGGNLICRGDFCGTLRGDVFCVCVFVRSFVLCILVVFEMGFGLDLPYGLLIMLCIVSLLDSLKDSTLQNRSFGRLSIVCCATEPEYVLVGDSKPYSSYAHLQSARCISKYTSELMSKVCSVSLILAMLVIEPHLMGFETFSAHARTFIAEPLSYTGILKLMRESGSTSRNPTGNAWGN